MTHATRPTPKLVILDRDGVINHDSDSFIKSPSEWQPIEGSLEAIVRLKHAGIRVAVASNQSGLARGLFEYDALFAIHDKMARQLADLGVSLDGVFFCPHLAQTGCDCRKPAPGLLDDILERWSFAPSDTVMIGDKISDMQAGHAAGVHAVAVRTGKPIDDTDSAWSDIDIYDDLAAAVDHLL